MIIIQAHTVYRAVENGNILGEFATYDEAMAVVQPLRLERKAQASQAVSEQKAQIRLARQKERQAERELHQRMTRLLKAQTGPDSGYSQDRVDAYYAKKHTEAKTTETPPRQ